jgi:hypothetical protein
MEKKAVVDILVNLRKEAAPNVHVVAPASASVAAATAAANATAAAAATTGMQIRQMSASHRSMSNHSVAVTGHDLSKLIPGEVWTLCTRLVMIHQCKKKQHMFLVSLTQHTGVSSGSSTAEGSSPYHQWALDFFAPEGINVNKNKI